MWCEKYRPKTFEECLMDDEIKRTMTSLKEVNHFLFHGSYGIGKTTTAKILIDTYAPNDNLIINFSEENGIDTIRNKIKDFISYMAFNAKHKIILCDEFDGSTNAAQDALRNMMEEYSSSARFIFTCNDIEKISPAIISRTQSFEFKAPSLNMIWGLVKKILKAEKIVVETKDIDSLTDLIKHHYPDIRKTLNELQKACSINNKFHPPKNDANFYEEIYNELSKGGDLFKIREKIIKNEDKFGCDYLKFYRYFFNKFVEKQDKAAIELINQYIEKHSYHLDKEINFFAFLIESEKHFK